MNFWRLYFIASWRKFPYKFTKTKIFIYAFNKTRQTALDVILVNVRPKEYPLQLKSRLSLLR